MSNLDLPHKRQGPIPQQHLKVVTHAEVITTCAFGSFYGIPGPFPDWKSGNPFSRFSPISRMCASLVITSQINIYIIYFTDIQYLQLIQSEATASPHTHVVLECWASYDGAQITSDRSGSNTASLLDSVLLPPLLSCWLVEPGAHITLPVFVEMGVGDDIVPLRSHDGTEIIKYIVRNEVT